MVWLHSIKIAVGYNYNKIPIWLTHNLKVIIKYSPEPILIVISSTNSEWRLEYFSTQLKFRHSYHETV